MVCLSPWWLYQETGSSQSMTSIWRDFLMKLLWRSFRTPLMMSHSWCLSPKRGYLKVSIADWYPDILLGFRTTGAEITTFISFVFYWPRPCCQDWWQNAVAVWPTAIRMGLYAVWPCADKDVWWNNIGVLFGWNNIGILMITAFLIAA